MAPIVNPMRRSRRRKTDDGQLSGRWKLPDESGRAITGHSSQEVLDFVSMNHNTVTDPLVPAQEEQTVQDSPAAQPHKVM